MSLPVLREKLLRLQGSGRQPIALAEQVVVVGQQYRIGGGERGELPVRRIFRHPETIEDGRR
jgi:hypothetical protein